MREKGVIMMLEEEDLVVKGVESDAFRAGEDVCELNSSIEGGGSDMYALIRSS